MQGFVLVCVKLNLVGIFSQSVGLIWTAYQRKASYKKAMLFNTYTKWRSTANWEAYRKQRNLTTNIKLNSVRTYFDERCAGGPKSKDVWPTVKPFLTNKGHCKDPTINLSEDHIIISDQTSVSNVINDLYVNVDKDVGRAY